MNDYLDCASNQFFSQFDDIDFDRYYVCFYEVTHGDNYEIVQYLASLSDEVQEVELLYFEDESKGSMALVDKENSDLIGLLNRYSVTYFKQFGCDIISILPAFDSFDHHLPEKTKKKADFFADKVIGYGYFESTDEIYSYYKEYFLPKWRIIIEPQLAYINNYSANRLRWNDILKKLKLSMREDGKLSNRWKSEFSLYLLAKDYFDEVEYQYRTEWLGAQSIDIFIPSINVGIEYQGIQHYQPVSYFGGEKHFVESQERDKRKKALCEENNVFLIEWPYTEGVEANNFVRILEKNGFSIGRRKYKKENNINKDYIDQALLLNNSSYSDLETSKDIVSRAIKNKDVSKLYEIFECAFSEKKNDVVDELLSAMATEGGETIVYAFVNTVYNQFNISGKYANKESLLGDLLGIIVMNNDFTTVLINNAPANYRSITYLLYYIKYVSLSEGIVLLKKLMENSYQKYEVGPDNNNVSYQTRSFKEYVKSKTEFVPEKMSQMFISYKSINKVCDSIGIEIKSERH